MGWLRRLFGSRNLNDVLSETKTVRIQGVRFVIRKIDPLAHMMGSKVMQANFEEYKNKKAMTAPAPMDAERLKATREHFRDMFLAAVVHPKICRNKEDANDDVIPVDNLLTDWALANEIYAEIVLFTYGKKKLSRSSSLDRTFES
ncbi:MAG: hypothetical protein C4586_05925 [Anaerolineaceae bacterium]|nr:MAG: hypothetical protein C4586_05925 [Anaerolineaceae bacterium]